MYSLCIICLQHYTQYSMSQVFIPRSIIPEAFIQCFICFLVTISHCIVFQKTLHSVVDSILFHIPSSAYSLFGSVLYPIVYNGLYTLCMFCGLLYLMPYSEAFVNYSTCHVASITLDNIPSWKIILNRIPFHILFRINDRLCQRDYSTLQ